jgi:hypothetical protein
MSDHELPDYEHAFFAVVVARQAFEKTKGDSKDREDREKITQAFDHMEKYLLAYLAGIRNPIRKPKPTRKRKSLS